MSSPSHFAVFLSHFVVLRTYFVVFRNHFVQQRGNGPQNTSKPVIMLVLKGPFL